LLTVVGSSGVLGVVGVFVEPEVPLPVVPEVEPDGVVLPVPLELVLEPEVTVVVVVVPFVEVVV
jgi:hypothetical protein